MAFKNNLSTVLRLEIAFLPYTFLQTIKQRKILKIKRKEFKSDFIYILYNA